ncbi:MAG TPA: substrate-binding domain-containing protein [Methylomirabilota bacterium]|nr:substrate-binding domain-containing protein [Methylomirabilota bacterium]
MADGPRLTALGKIFIFLFVVLCGAGAYYFFNKNNLNAGKAKNASSGGGVFDSLTGSGEQVELGIAYGTEKQRWLEWAVQEFAKTKDGKRIKINLIPMGSLEGAHALLNGDQRIQVWSPASALYKDIFVEEWQVKYSQNPILKEEPIALSPMVFVMWEERYQAFIQKYKTVSFATVGQALQEKGGWDAIAQKPDWGLFKFGHTHPNESNSGLMTIVLAAYSYQKKTKDLTLKDVVDVGFQNWMQGLERAVSGLSNSTGNMMKEMVLKGPSSYDALFVYESVTIDYLKNAEGRWGQLRIIYPEYNAWNENPYYIIDAPWSSKEQRKAAEAFLAFLLTEPIQKESLNHGFRPANPNVPVKFPDSPFVKYADYGIKVDLAKICEPPKAEVVNNLLQSWQRSQAGR